MAMAGAVIEPLELAEPAEPAVTPPVVTPPAAAPIVRAAPPPPARGVPVMRLLSVIAQLVLSFGLFVGCVRLYSLDNDAPLNGHPDEPGKLGQLLSDDRNYNHPMLMLEAAKHLIDLPKRDAPPDANRPPTNPQLIMEQARGVSARFAAGAAVLMAWAGLAAAGWLGFLGVGLAVGLCPALLSHAHFFKEDTSLMFGIALVLCAGAWALRVRGQGVQLWTILALGIGCGLAAAGKYCGVVMLAPALPIAVIAAAKRRHWALLLAAPLLVSSVAVVTWLAVDYRVFDDFNRFVDSFDREKNHSEEQHYGITMDKPNTFFRDAVWREAMPHVKVLAVLGVGLLVWQIVRRRPWGFGLWLLLTGILYLVMLGYSIIPFYRYALPVTVMLYGFAGLSFAWGVTLPRRWWQRGLVFIGGLALIGGLQWYRCADYTQQFADDSRDAVRDWVDANLPAGTPVVIDTYSQLSTGRGWGPWFQPPNTKVRIVRGLENGVSIEPLDVLRRNGVQYVITAGTECERYTDPHVKAAPGSEHLYDSRAAFYRSLRDCPIAWSRVAAHPMGTFANPDIVVYRLGDAAAR